MWYFIFVGIRAALFALPFVMLPAIGIAIGWGWGVWCAIQWGFTAWFVNRYYLRAAIETQRFLRFG